VTDQDLEAQRKTATKVFWHSPDQDMAIINVLRVQAGLPPIVPDTSA
jgi:hypothetical protein